MQDLTHEKWKQLDSLLDEALNREPAERTAYLRATCGDDPDLYHTIASLLESAQAGESEIGESVSEFVEPLFNLIQTETSELGLASGERVGPYQIVRELGKGGMGTVYLAERADGAFEKEVALKVVRGMRPGSSEAQRFQQERQILAGLDHEGIARLLDGGVTNEGVQYLVMEYVDGQTVTAFAEHRQLDTEARIDLVHQVAEAVAYAHRRLVIHQDLKPSNVLVSDGEGGDHRVKLLDFGIARLLNLDAHEEEDEKLPATLRLTPAYAAPEQLGGGEVTTATDVYALGVLLYELLTGRHPADISGKNINEVIRAVSSERIQPPSQVAGEVSYRSQLQGDLDAITLKALARNPESRYASVDALLDDLSRRRRHLPVHAREHTRGYRIQTFVRRHRVGMGAAALVALIVLVGGLTVAWQARIAAYERDVAQREAATADEVTDFLVGLFERTDPTLAGGDTLSAHEILSRGIDRIDTELAEQPEVRARMYEVLGQLYNNLGDFAQGDVFLEQSVALHREVYGNEHPETLGAMFHYFATLHGRSQDEDEMARMDSLIDAWQASIDAQRSLGPEHAEQMIAVADFLTYRPRADSLVAVRQIEQRMDLYERALDINRNVYGNNNLIVAENLLKLGASISSSGFAPLSRGVLRNTTPEPVFTQGVEYRKEGVQICRRLLPESHNTLIEGLQSLGASMMEVERYEEALSYLQEMYDRQLELAGPDHIQTNSARVYLALVYNRMERYEDAEETMLVAWNSRMRTAGENDMMALVYRRMYGETIRNQGRYAEAETHLLEVYRRFDEMRGDTNGFTQQSVHTLIKLYEDWGREEDAESYRALVTDVVW